MAQRYTTDYSACGVRREIQLTRVNDLVRPQSARTLQLQTTPISVRLYSVTMATYQRHQARRYFNFLDVG